MRKSSYVREEKGTLSKAQLSRLISRLDRKIEKKGSPEAVQLSFMLTGMHFLGLRKYPKKVIYEAMGYSNYSIALDKERGR